MRLVRPVLKRRRSGGATVDFYTRQAQARRQTRWLVIAFIVAMRRGRASRSIWCCSPCLGLQDERSPGISPLQFVDAAIPASALVLHARRAGGDRAVEPLQVDSAARGRAVWWRARSAACASGATRTDLKRKRLHNVVEEMAIASGVPMPEIYVLEQESGHQRVRRGAHAGERGGRGHAGRARHG